LCHARLEFRREDMIRDETIALLVTAPKLRTVCLAKAGRRFDQGVEDNLQVEGRAADYLERVGGCSLLLQGFAQLVEQARVLDGDDGLCGEVGQHRDLLVCERPNFLPENAEGAD